MQLLDMCLLVRDLNGGHLAAPREETMYFLKTPSILLRNLPKFAQTQSLRTNFDTLSSNPCKYDNGRVSTRLTPIY